MNGTGNVRRAARTAARILLAVGLGIPLAAAAGTAAMAGPKICKAGATSVTFSQVYQPWYVTHAETYPIPAGGAITRTETMQVVASVTATVTGSGSLGVVIPAFEAKFGLDIANANAHTSTSSTTITLSLRGPGTFVAFEGVRRVTATWSLRSCNEDGTGWVPAGSGKLLSYYGKGRGAINCADRQPAGSLAAVAKGEC